MKQFERDVLHWINYDYVVINENLEKCYSKIYNLFKQKLMLDQKIMIKSILETYQKINFLIFHIHSLGYNKFENLNFEVLISNLI